MLDYIFWGGGTLKIGTQGISSIPFIVIFFIVFQIDHHVTEDCPKTKMDCDFLEIGCNHNVRILHYSIYCQDSVQFDWKLLYRSVQIKLVWVLSPSLYIYIALFFFSIIGERFFPHLYPSLRTADAFLRRLEMRLLFRLRVVPHFSSGIVERAKRERALKSPLTRKDVVYLLLAVYLYSLASAVFYSPAVFIITKRARRTFKRK